MLPTAAYFEEIRVYEGIAEKTGTKIDRETLRGRKGICRSMMELSRKARRLGDGYFYIPSIVWPEGTEQVELSKPWIPLGSIGSDE